MEQTVINWAVALAGTLGGFLMNSSWQAVRDLQTADKALADKVASVEVVVVGDYVRRSEFTDNVKAIFAKLDRIEDKLDGKVDR